MEKTPDKFKTGARGENHPKAKLTDHEVELVRQLKSEGFSYGEISRKMEVPKSTIIDWCKYRTR